VTQDNKEEDGMEWTPVSALLGPRELAIVAKVQNRLFDCSRSKAIRFIVDDYARKMGLQDLDTAKAETKENAQ
jgi:hypothetical protein